MLWIALITYAVLSPVIGLLVARGIQVREVERPAMPAPAPPAAPTQPDVRVLPCFPGRTAAGIRSA